MSLNILFDDELERLADRLIRHLESAGPGDPFDSDVLIVPGLGTGGWLQRRIADRLGVAMRVELEFPGRFLWRMAGRAMPGLPERSPFDVDRVRWQVLALLESLAGAGGGPSAEVGGLPACGADEGFALLAARVRQASSRQRLILATEIASLFDRYLGFRRDWLDAWQQGRTVGGLGVHEAWQAWLWRSLLARTLDVSQQHPLARLAERLRGDDPLTLGVRQIVVYGLQSMSPEQMLLFGLLGRHLPVCFAAQEPSHEFWHDVVSPRQAAQIRTRQPELAWLYDSEPSILGHWGQAHRDYLAQLRAFEDAFAATAAGSPHGGLTVDDRFRDLAPRAPVNRLQALRASLQRLSDAPWHELARSDDALPDDGSLQVHGCHGVTRQVEVLFDVLCRAFDADPALRPDQVVVFCADCDAFGPAIDAVFGDGPLPYRISGRSPLGEPLTAALLAMLALALGDAQRAGIEMLLENPAIHAAWGWTAQDHRLVLGWLARAGVFGGLPATGDEPATRHGWRQALDRLWLGYGLAEDAFAGRRGVDADLLAVAGVGGGQLVLLERMETLIGSLALLHARAAERLAPAEWVGLLRGSLQWLFEARGLRSAQWQLRVARIDEALSRLIDSAACAGPSGSEPPPLESRIDLAAFALAVEEALHQGAGSATAAGAISFVPMGALAGVPFRVVSLLGMDEGAFPRVDRPPEFDLMAVRSRFGDRLARRESRGAFLDALLAAASQVTIVYQAHDVRDNQELNPSPVVQELIDYVSRQPGQSGFAPIVHPLQVFAPANFRDDGRPSYAGRWLEPARQLRRRRVQPGAPSEDRETDSQAAGAGATRNSASGGSAMDRNAPDTASEPLATRVARLEDCWRTGGAGPASPAVELPTHRLVARALADPAGGYLGLGQGVRLPYETDLADPIEPLDAHPAQEIELLDEALAVEGDPDAMRARIAAWRASPRMAEGAWGRRTQAALEQRLDALLAERQRLIGGARSEDGRLVDVIAAGVAWHGGPCWLDLSDPAAPCIRQVLLRARVTWRGRIEAWLAHHALQALVDRGQGRVPWAGASATAGSDAAVVSDSPASSVASDSPVPDVQTHLIAPGESLRIASALRGEQALAAAAALAAWIQARPESLFPRTYEAFVAAAGDSSVADMIEAGALLPTGPAPHADERVRKAWQAARRRLEGSPGGHQPMSPESAYLWPATLYRQQLPGLLEILRVSEAAYRPIVTAFEKHPPAKPRRSAALADDGEAADAA